MDRDTIAAIATAPGAGGIAIVRLSGDRAEVILGDMFRPVSASKVLISHKLTYGTAVDGDGSVIDEVMAVIMRAPSSYTREDVCEVHCHGGHVSAQRVLDRALDLGARMAQPGEFTKRAFMNGRIDLSRAEAVMELINATSVSAARASVRQLEGGVSSFVRGAADELIDLMALIEASDDFPDEVEEEAAAEQVIATLRALIASIRLRCDAKQARILREGASVVLAGRPNVGKSSLMNALLHRDRAIVTDIPGTTRDVLTEQISFGGIRAELSDTAGRRVTDDPIEKLGVDRAERAADIADVIAIVIDASSALDHEDIGLLTSADERCIVCLNKSDLTSSVTASDITAYTSAPIFVISTVTGEGIPALVTEIASRIAVDGEQDGRMVTRRHIECAERAAAHLENAIASLESGFPLDAVAVDLREALSDLTEITGENATESVIDRVFSTFCVGK